MGSSGETRHTLPVIQITRFLTSTSTKAAAWVAYPENKPHIFSTSVNTQEVRAWYRPQLAKHLESISFGDARFWNDPNVFVAWNMFDIDCGFGFRLNMYTDNVTQQGLTWHINAWVNTVLYAVGATIIAVN